MATSICLDKTVGELGSSGGTGSKQAVHTSQEDTQEKTDMLEEFGFKTSRSHPLFFFLRDISG